MEVFVGDNVKRLWPNEVYRWFVPLSFTTITKEKEGTSETTLEYSIWKQNDYAIMTLLAATLSSDVLSFVVGSNTSRELWCLLKERYASTSWFNKEQLKTNFYKLQKGSDSIDKYLDRVKLACDQLANVGIRMTDEDIIVSVLLGLPSDYTTMKTIIRAKHNPISIQELRSLLLIAEAEIEEANKFSLLSKTGIVAHGDSFRRYAPAPTHATNAKCDTNAMMPTSSVASSIGYVTACTPKMDLIYAANTVLKNESQGGFVQQLSSPSESFASPTTTQYGSVTSQNTMNTSTCFAIPPTLATSPTSFQHNFIPSNGNYQSISSMGNNGFMMSKNMRNEGSYSAMPSLFGVSHRTSGFIAQHGSNMSVPFSHQQQQNASTTNNCNYNSTPHQNATLSQQNFSPQTVQHGSLNNGYENGFNNSFASGGYLHDSASYPNLPNNKDTNNHNNRSSNIIANPRTTGNFSDVIVCQCCEKQGHGAWKCFQKNSQPQNSASCSTIVCQICKRLGHSTKTCRYRQQSRNNSPQPMAASFFTQPKSVCIAAQPSPSTSMPLIPPG